MALEETLFMVAGENPYLAPQAPIGPPVEPTRYSRWSVVRWIPAIYCAMMAFAGLLWFLGTGVMTAWLLLKYGIQPFETRLRSPLGSLTRIFAVWLLMGIGGTSGVLATRAWIKRRWWFAVLCSIVIFLGMVPGRLLIESFKFSKISQRAR